MEKYIQMAKDLGIENARLISPQDIFFDIRAILKCRWGCEDFFMNSIRCHSRNTTFEERIEMVRSYRNILMLHSHNPQALSAAVLEVERAAFLDGYYFAFALRTCNLCKTCAISQGKPCPSPHKVRPCDQSFGIDIYKTARALGFPIQVLKSQEERQNRYGFVLID